MTKLLFLVAIFFCCFLAACSMDLMPSAKIECRVIDADTHRPLEAAKLLMVYRGPEVGELIKRGPFFTNVHGTAYIVTSSEVLTAPPGSIAFAGGYRREIWVEKEGYVSSEFCENLDRGLFDKQAPLLLKLAPSHNHFGSVEVLAYDNQSIPQRLELGVWDGPHGGEHLSISIKPPESSAQSPRGSYYLRKSIEEIKAEALRNADVVYDLNEILRRGSLYQLREPYTPRKSEPNQSAQTTPVSAPR